MTNTKRDVLMMIPEVAEFDTDQFFGRLGEYSLVIEADHKNGFGSMSSSRCGYSNQALDTALREAFFIGLQKGRQTTMEKAR